MAERTTEEIDKWLTENEKAGVERLAMDTKEVRMLLTEYKRMRTALLHIMECDRAFGGQVKEERYRIEEHLETDTALVADCVWGLTGIETPTTPSMID